MGYFRGFYLLKILDKDMWVESFNKDFESNENLPKLKQASPEEVKKVWEDIEYSNHLKKVNDVLGMLDFPDKEDNKFRKVLSKLDNETLKDISTKKKSEILTFIVKEHNELFKDFSTEDKNKLLLFISKEMKKVNTSKKESTKRTIDKTLNIESKETQKQNIENKEFNLKILKIKSIFTIDILNKNPDISQNFEALELAKTTQEKEAIIQKILELVKQPWRLETIVKELWWANKNNPRYQRV